ncbi:MAG: hypothetical protein PHU61_03570 [Candidatus Absconditabacteria bacterium]|nr:hypothetical protein [Candidatus Absconditabacteria bacterium]MDD4714463.1 hypothetical protein [Candidatus Absconditabacteria bacterium]
MEKEQFIEREEGFSKEVLDYNRALHTAMNNPQRPLYDRGPGDDESQLIGVSKTPGSLVSQKKGNGVPSRRRHEGD